MEQGEIINGIEHGGHLSTADKSEIYSVIQPVPVIHPVAETRKSVRKKVSKKAARKGGKKARKSGKAKHAKSPRL